MLLPESAGLVYGLLNSLPLKIDRVPRGSRIILKTIMFQGFLLAVKLFFRGVSINILKVDESDKFEMM